MDDNTALVLELVRLERLSQDIKWGEQNHLLPYWLTIILEELGEAAKDILQEKSSVSIVTELVQTAASVVAMIECMIRSEKERLNA